MVRHLVRAARACHSRRWRGPRPARAPLSVVLYSEPMDVDVLPGPQAVADEAARQAAAIAVAAIAARGRFLVALSGGSTPRAMHACLAASYARALDWSLVEFFWSDDRAVPPEHPDSNYRMARETLLEPLRIGETHVHRIRGEADGPAGGGRRVRAGARRCPCRSPTACRCSTSSCSAWVWTATPRRSSRTPPALDVADRWVVPNRAPRPPVDRITLTFPVILAARHVRVLVTGADKAGTLASVLHGAADPRRLPAQRLAAVAAAISAGWWTPPRSGPEPRRLLRSIEPCTISIETTTTTTAPARLAPAPRRSRRARPPHPA